MPVFARRAALLFFYSVGLALAADANAPIPEAGDSAAAVPQEPEVTITQRGRERVEEFRVNNQLYMLKITPAKGYPYYLVDTTGKGNFDMRRSQLGSNFAIPQWVLLRWK